MLFIHSAFVFLFKSSTRNFIYFFRCSKILATKYGKGKSCKRIKAPTASCFKKCCNGYFNCHKKKKCIREKYKCNYYNNCGSNEDEDDKLCQEKCFIKYSRVQYDGKGQIQYMDRQDAICGAQHALQMFRLVRVKVKGKKSYLRYQMKCCKLNGKVTRKRFETKPVYSRNILDLRHHNVKCPRRSFMSGFGLDGNRNHGKVHLYYFYFCNVWNLSSRSKQKCKTSYTRWYYFISSTNGIQVLDRHNVDCAKVGPREEIFLSPTGAIQIYMLPYIFLNHHKENVRKIKKD